MPRSRSIPTNLYWDKAFCALSDTAQNVLIGLTLNADDWGRGVAESGILARQLNKEAGVIDQALLDLEAKGFIHCYQAQDTRCFQHLKWEIWESGLREDRRAPSEYPAPPQEQTEACREIPGNAASSSISLQA